MRKIVELGEIWYGEKDAVQNQIQDLNSEDELIIVINSGGGSVLEGYALYNTLLRCPAKKTAYISGLCASMATLVSLAADKIIASPFSIYMTHLSSTFDWGNEKQLSSSVDLLRKIDAIAIQAYGKKTQKPESFIIERLMNGFDSWLSPNEALEIGLIDEIVEADKMDIPLQKKPEYAEFMDFFQMSVKNQKEFISKKIKETMSKKDNLPQATENLPNTDAQLAALHSEKENLAMRVSELEEMLKTMEAQGSNKDAALSKAKEEHEKAIAELQKTFEDKEKEVISLNIQMQKQEKAHRVHLALAEMRVAGQMLPKEKRDTIANNFLALHSIAITSEGESVVNNIDKTSAFDSITEAVHAYSVRNGYVPMPQ